MDQADSPEPISAPAPDPITPPSPDVNGQPISSLIKIEVPRLALRPSASICDSIRNYCQQAKTWLARKRQPTLFNVARATYFWAKYQVIHPPFELHAKYTDARYWLVSFKPPKPSDDYKYALEYAWKKYEEVSQSSNTLDDKAKNMMQASGIVLGIVGSLVGVAIQANKIGWIDITLLMPAVVAFLLSLILATIACAPAAGSTPASVRDLLDDIGDGHGHDGYTAASMHCAITGRIAINDWKAGRIRRSIACFCIGLIALLLPLVV